MTRRKKEISFTTYWGKGVLKGTDHVVDLYREIFILAVPECIALGKRIIRALGKKEGKIEIILRRIE